MRLTVETGPLAGTVVPLDRDHPAILGSGEDCAVRVQEAGVAPHHAVVKALRDQGFGIKALTAGVRLNGAVIEASPLSDGDVIELGTTRIAFGNVQKRGLPTIAGYRILGELGRGGMGMVYRAEQTSLHREVALKVLNKELVQDPQFVARFVAEARAAAKLQHPNVVAVFDVEHDHGTYYYAMELMPDGSLEDWLKQNGAMPADRALQVVADAAAGLAYAESLGIVHRDIKPDNLMLDQHGAVKIADLGLAGTEADAEEKAVGTPHFMAPEQVLKKEIDHRTDLYALGCTFYRLVTGRTPFRGQSVKDILRAQVKDEAEPAHKVNDAVPVEVSAIIQRLMAKEPGDRFQTANELIEQLQVLMQPPAKKGLWIALAAVAVLVAGGAVWWAVTKPKDIETRTQYVDNPEAARLANENEQLRADLAEKSATIALLEARTSGLTDLALADQLERIAREHAGRRAAVEAGERATALRREVDQRAAAASALRQAGKEYVAGLRQKVQPLLASGDFGAATQLLAAKPPAELAGDGQLASDVAALATEVTGAATARLRGVTEHLAKAAQSGDTGALAAAIDAAAAATTAAEAWPSELRDGLDDATRQLATARTTLAELEHAQQAAQWQRFAQFVRGQDGFAGRLEAGEFGSATALAQQFAAADPKAPPAVRAEAFAAIAGPAEAMAKAIEQAIASGKVTVPNDDGPPLTVTKWERATGRLTVADLARKPAKESSLELGQLGGAGWTALLGQVPAELQPAAETGARTCFLALMALADHLRAAQPFLAGLRAEDDASGTGDHGYPLGAGAFDDLLRSVAQGDAAWTHALRAELQAGQLLAAGLRALSERRNLAAANYLDRVLAEFPHSLAVTALP